MSKTIQALTDVAKNIPSAIRDIIPKFPTLAQLAELQIWPGLDINKNHRTLATVLVLTFVLSILSMFATGDDLLSADDSYLGADEPTLMEALSDTWQDAVGAFIGAPKPKTSTPPKPKTKKHRAAKFFWSFFMLFFFSWIIVNQVVVAPRAGAEAAYVPYRSSYRPSYRSY